MLKYLRKYNKSILVVGGVLLMIAFLLPSTLNRIGREQQNRTVAKIDGRSVSARTIGKASLELSIVDEALFGVAKGPPFNIERAEHWEMLSREAKAGGFIGGAGQADKIIEGLAPSFAEAQMRRFGPEARNNAELREQVYKRIVDAMRSQVNQAVQRFGPDIVDDAMSKFAGITLMRAAHDRAARVSEPEALVVAHDFLDRADVDAAVIRADDLAASVAEPSEADLLAHFEKHKSVAPGTPGETGQGFGYLQPAAVKLEWLTLDVGALAALVTPDQIEVRKRWQGDRTKYPGEFADEKAKVEGELKADLVGQAMREADQIVRAEIAQEQKRLPDEGRWKALPANWKDSVRSLSAIAAAVKEKLTARGIPYTPTFTARMKWLSTADMAAMQGVGDATLPIGARKVAIFEMYPEVKEIGGKEARGPQVGVLTGPAISPLGNFLYIRLLDARPEGPPATLDEVREQVVRDVKDIQAFAALREKAPEILAKAVAGGLSAIAAEYPKASALPGIVSRKVAMFGADRSPLNTPEFRDAVMNAAMKLDPTKPVADAPAESRFVVAVIPGSMSVAVGEIKGLEPLTKEDFEQRIGLIADAARQRNDLPALDDPFSYARMKERHGWVTMGGKKSEDEDEGGSNGATPSAAKAAGTKTSAATPAKTPAAR